MNLEDMLHVRAGAEMGHPPPDDLTGRWTNDLGSVMELQCDSSCGSLTGTYTSGVRDRHTYGIVGYANATTVVFSVNFTSSASIGAWAGHFDPATHTLDMLWHLVSEPRAGEVWDTTFAGFDTFTRSS